MISKNEKYKYTGYVTIQKGDWDYPRYMTDIASRIVADWKFEEECRKRSFNRNRFNKMKRGVI